MKSIADQKLNLPTYAPVMVLPGVHLFPQMDLPLYIFEPRYRAMLTWCLEQHRMFCIAPMKTGVSEAHSENDFHHLVGLGLVRACVARPDGTSHLVLQGLARVRLVGFLQETPFRLAEVREAPSRPAPEAEVRQLATDLLHVCALMRAKGLELPEVMRPQVLQARDPGVRADVIAHYLLRDPAHRQEVFAELRVAERVGVLWRSLMAENPSPKGES